MPRWSQNQLKSFLINQLKAIKLYLILANGGSIVDEALDDPIEIEQGMGAKAP
jgi:hypothetical protein